MNVALRALILHDGRRTHRGRVLDLEDDAALSLITQGLADRLDSERVIAQPKVSPYGVVDRTTSTDLYPPLAADLVLVRLLQDGPHSELGGDHHVRASWIYAVDSANARSLIANGAAELIEAA
jgi:hypothetical protein